LSECGEGVVRIGRVSGGRTPEGVKNGIGMDFIIHVILQKYQKY
jgi:hypothetical protein